MSKSKGKVRKGQKVDNHITWPRYLRPVLMLSLVAVLTCGGYLGWAWLKAPSTLPLEVVRIEGDYKYLDRRDLEQAVAEQLNSGFFGVDVEAVQRAVRALPWVDEASVRRVWPKTLQIWVTEQVPLARWNDRELLNTRGEVFSPVADEIPTGLPRLAGPKETSQEMAVRYLEMQQQLMPLDLRILRLNQDDRGAWISALDAGPLIRLGSRDVTERLARFIRLYPQLKSAGKGVPKEVDLRYTNGLVVHWPEQPGDEASAVSENNRINRGGLA